MSSSPSFAVASALETTSAPGTFRANVPDGWQQGRGAFGGLVLGTMLRGIERAETDPSRALRSLSGELCAPVLPGEADVIVRELRRGSNMTYWEARLEQRGEIVARASAVLARGRQLDGALAEAKAARAVSAVGATFPSAGWSEVAPVDLSGGPVFASHYEYRSTGPLPFAGGEAPYTAGWVRERGPAGPLDAPAVVALTDAWWPTIFSLDDRLRPIATIAFTLELLADPSSLPAPDVAPLFYAARAPVIRDGFFVEMRELWDVAGAAGSARPVAMNQQTFAVLR